MPTTTASATYSHSCGLRALAAWDCPVIATEASTRTAYTMKDITCVAPTLAPASVALSRALRR